MLIKACNMITRISDDEVVNTENYLSGLSYISNLYTFLNHLKLVLSLEDVEFLPTFKGKYVVEKLGIASTSKENEMKVFRVKSSVFREDKETVKSIRKEMGEICERIVQEGDTVTFYLP